MAKIEPANLLLKDKNGNTGLVKSLTNKDITTLKNVVTNVGYIKDFVNANGGSLPIQGDLKLTATDAAGKNGKILLGTSSGTLQWNGKNIVRSVNGINADANGNVVISDLNEMGYGYIRFTNGFQLCFGASSTSNPNVSFPKPFSQVPVVICSGSANSHGWGTSNLSSTGFTIMCSIEAQGQYFYFFAIGYWK